MTAKTIFPTPVNVPDAQLPGPRPFCSTTLSEYTKLIDQCLVRNPGERPTLQTIGNTLLTIAIAEQVAENIAMEQARQTRASMEQEQQERASSARDCGVCYEEMTEVGERRMAVGPCCHVFCRTCWERAATINSRCPTCRGFVLRDQIKDLYF
jgi:hypothetical protein